MALADADRLRQAAEKVLWDSTFLQESDFPELQNERRQKERVADLLRAVADMHCLQPGEPDDGPCNCPEHLAALALADVILEERA